MIDGSTPGTGTDHYSQMQVAGSVALNSATLDITLGPDFTPSVPTSFTIIDNTGTSAVSGTFDGQAQGSTIVVPFGDTSVTFAISYDGGANSNSVVLTEVNPSTTTVTADPTSSVYGQSVDLTAKVTGPTGDPTPTGTVDFYSNASNVATLLGPATLDDDGAATLPVTTLAVATNSITAQYLGDGNYGGSTSAPTPVTVTMASATASLVVFPVAPVEDEQVTLTATVAAVSPGAGTPTGDVNFLNGSTSLGSEELSAAGVATLPTSIIPAGTNSITADYAGDGNFGAVDSLPVPVTVVATPTSTTTLAASTNVAGFWTERGFHRRRSRRSARSRERRRERSSS